MIIKCAIVDDEPLAVELLASYVKKIPFLELCGKYSNAGTMVPNMILGKVFKCKKCIDSKT